MREINTALTERLECGDLLAARDTVIATQDSIITEQADIIVTLNRKYALLQDSYNISQQKANELAVALSESDAGRLAAQADVKRLKKGRNTWRLASIVQGVAIIGYLFIKR